MEPRQDGGGRALSGEERLPRLRSLYEQIVLDMYSRLEEAFFSSDPRAAERAIRYVWQVLSGLGYPSGASPDEYIGFFLDKHLRGLTAAGRKQRMRAAYQAALDEAIGELIRQVLSLARRAGILPTERPPART